jgi:hypothetical protein
MVHREVSGKEITNITEESFAVVDVVRCDCILVKLVGRGAFLITQLN